ncbi:MAG TPA: hypothetical protein VKZ18_16145 [Polyangia bacterium]|nr:hypothetical protein [Polyangia bacterium]
MRRRVCSKSNGWRVLRWTALAAAAPALWACTSRGLEAPAITPTATLQTHFNQKINNQLDILFMIDNSSSMAPMQQKLYDQLPSFMQVLQKLPTPPSLHVAVVSSDMGAPGDETGNIKCTQYGDQGQFQFMPRSDTDLGITCTDTTLAPGATFISDEDMTPNFTNPDISQVFQCIAFLGDKGCGFENQLASIDRALGADGSAAPSTNANFLRQDAYLGIVLLTNEDDCSAPPNTKLYSLGVGGSGQQNIANALGPLANYRCNQFGHLCKDPGGNVIAPPLDIPADAMGTSALPTLDMTDCTSNDTTGLLTPVSQFVSDVRALKDAPDDKILVAAIAAPAAPYTVEWLPEYLGQNTQPGELWPSIMHSCGAKGASISGADVNPESTMSPTDGSFGDPGVRISQFVKGFSNYVLASICDATYAESMNAIATKLGQLITPPCITGTIQTDGAGQPLCSVIEHLSDGAGNTSDRSVASCAATGNALPCWKLDTGAASCGGQQLTIKDEPGVNTNTESSTIDCSLCLPGSQLPGCP